MEIQAALERLCSIGAPTGFERPAALAAKELLEPLVDEVKHIVRADGGSDV